MGQVKAAVNVAKNATSRPTWLQTPAPLLTVDVRQVASPLQASPASPKISPLPDFPSLPHLPSTSPHLTNFFLVCLSHWNISPSEGGDFCLFCSLPRIWLLEQAMLTVGAR